MPERKFADSYEMNIKEIHSAIMQQLFNLEYFELFNSADEEREQALENRINNIMVFDERFKSSFNNDMQIAMNLASCNGFENSLRIGLSLLKNLLTAELPEIHIVKHEPDRTERRCTPIHQPSDVDPVFIDYIKNVCPHLKDEQKFILQGRAEYLFEKNILIFFNQFFHFFLCFPVKVLLIKIKLRTVLKYWTELFIYGEEKCFKLTSCQTYILYHITEYFSTFF